MILSTIGFYYTFFLVMGLAGGLVLGLAVFSNWDGHFYFKKGSDDEAVLVFNTSPEKMRKKDYLTIKVENLEPDVWDERYGKMKEIDRKEEPRRGRTCK